eukprot:TRINITY_DN2488_c2_g6_i1.p1 TRINITY_DN2488_c2_g6~~TRINITY_DN2488_c2_g6_i1.p1  ORF type:complete len:490 (-),score=65.52 TRINITY_DN2488_c2_g6_i1:57-1526(-)
MENAGHKNVSVADKVNEIGFGWYQVQAFILCSGFVIAEACCIATASGLNDAIRSEFDLETEFWKSFHLLTVFIGFALGTLSSGTLGDSFGRRLPMLIGYAGLVATAVMLYFSGTYEFLVTGFFCLGFFAALGVPAAFISISEISPTHLRGVTMAAMGAAFCAGELWAACGLRLIAPYLISVHWRQVFLWMALVPASLLTFGMISRVTRFDTPLFLAVRGSREDIFGVIDLIAEMNGKLACSLKPNEELVASKEHGFTLPEALIRLTNWPQFLYLAVLCFIFFSKDMAFFGMSVFWPLAWRTGMRVGGMYPATELMVTAVLGFPGVGFAMLIMYAQGRRAAFTLATILAALGVIAIHGILEEDAKTGLIGVFLFKFFYPTQQMITAILPSEIFSTRLRAWSYSFVGFFGRLSTLIAPFIVQNSKKSFLAINSALMIGAVFLVWFLPETKDCDLGSSRDSLDGRLVTGRKDSKAAYGSFQDSNLEEGQKSY